MLRIVGYRIGFLKVPHTRYLKEQVGLALADAKRVTDDVLAHRFRTVPCPPEDEPRHRAALEQLGAIVELVGPT